MAKTSTKQRKKKVREHQHVEWKESWRDEWLKWVCAFANTDGGILEVGKKDKTGEVVGIDDAEKLLENLPNRIRDLLGILPKVDLLTEPDKNGDDCELIRVTVQSYPHPISYKGEYHVRRGSTKQVLKGAELDQFLLRKYGKRWDAVPLPGVSLPELDPSAIDEFRSRAAESKRIKRKQLDATDQSLLDQLRLFEGDYLKRAAVLLFHPDPEAYFSGAWIKIGYFASESELLYQDEVHGNLFEQVDQTIDLLTTKYLKASINYRGIQRIERLPIPESAIRETVLNAITHRDYSSSTPIQIKVFEDGIWFWNNGQLPEGWDLSRLKASHPSEPFNPDIARVFFRAGMIESWGRGISEIMRACKQARVPEPDFRFEQLGLSVDFGFGGNQGTKSGPSQGPSQDQAATFAELTVEQRKTLEKTREAESLTELMSGVGRTNRTKFRNQVLRPLLGEGLIEMTIPDKPTSSQQKYRITLQGQAVLMQSGDQ